jgi:hypothetical protein
MTGGVQFRGARQGAQGSTARHRACTASR